MAEKEKTIPEAIQNIRDGIIQLNKIVYLYNFSSSRLQDDEQEMLKKINIEGLQFFKKFQCFTGVTDEDLKY